MAKRPISAKTNTKTLARRAKKPAATPIKAETKQDMVLAMLRRGNGASIAEIAAATDWQPHSVRGFFAGALKRRLRIDIVSEKNAETGERRYHVAPLKA